MYRLPFENPACEVFASRGAELIAGYEAGRRLKDLAAEISYDTLRRFLVLPDVPLMRERVHRFRRRRQALQRPLSPDEIVDKTSATVITSEPLITTTPPTTTPPTTGVMTLPLTTTPATFVT